MRKFVIVAIALVLPMIFGGIDLAAQKKQSKVENVPGFSNASYNYEVETVGVGTEGTKSLKVWAYGKTVDDAVQLAKKTAVAACIYRGLPASSEALATPPLCSSLGKEWDEYFAKFFSDGGDYLNFVNLTSDGAPAGTDRLKTKHGYKVGVYVQVLHDRLRKELEAKGVIKNMNSWF